MQIRCSSLFAATTTATTWTPCVTSALHGDWLCDIALLLVTRALELPPPVPPGPFRARWRGNMTFVLSVDGLRTVTQLQQRGRYTNKVSSIRNMTDAMNWSMFTADRATHLKVAVLGLSALLLIALIRIFGGG